MDITLWILYNNFVFYNGYYIMDINGYELINPISQTLNIPILCSQICSFIPHETMSYAGV